jgi:hypothetical protein
MTCLRRWSKADDESAAPSIAQACAMPRQGFVAPVTFHAVGHLPRCRIVRCRSAATGSEIMMAQEDGSLTELVFSGAASWRQRHAHVQRTV